MVLDLPDNPAIHAIFLFLFVTSMLTLLLTVFCDPGIVCGTETEDDLKLVRTIPSLLQKDIVYSVSNFFHRLLQTLFGENAWIHFV